MKQENIKTATTILFNGCTKKFPKSKKFFLLIYPKPLSRGASKKNFLEIPLGGFKGKMGNLSCTHFMLLTEKEIAYSYFIKLIYFLFDIKLPKMVKS